MKYLVITAILCLILAGASFAGNVTITEVLTGGNLTLTMPDNFSLPTMTLGGVDYSSGFSYATYAVEDSRGTGAGWNVGFQISQFVTTGTPQRTLGIDKYYMALESGRITCIYGQAKDADYGPMAWGISSVAHVTSTEVKGVRTQVNYGMGKYTIEPKHWILIDAYVYAGTYTATLTATLNNVP